MDLSKFKTTDWLKVGGAVAALVGYFLDWTNLPGSEFYDFNLSGSDFFFRGTVPFILTVATGVITFLLAAGMMKPGKLPWGVVFVLATGLSTVLVLLYIISPSYAGASGLGRGIGAWLTLIGCGVATAGSVMAFTAAGGNLKDLTDVNKMKAQFGRLAGSGHEAADNFRVLRYLAK